MSRTGALAACAARIGAALGRRDHGLRANLSEQARPHDRAVRGRRADRRDRAHRRVRSSRKASASSSMSRTCRRRRQHRHRAGREGAARRLHAAGREHRLHGQSEPLRQACPTTRSRILRRSRWWRRRPNVLTGQSVGARPRSVKELIELIKANPGQVSATPSRPPARRRISPANLFKLTFELDLVMVPFTGAALGRSLDHRRPHADRLHRAAAGDQQHQGRQAARRSR